jgi:hypothetical protein
MKQRHRKIAIVMALTFGGLALLIWAKMKVAGGVPRTAYAEPDAETSPDDAQGADPSNRP